MGCPSLVVWLQFLTSDQTRSYCCVFEPHSRINKYSPQLHCCGHALTLTPAGKLDIGGDVAKRSTEDTCPFVIIVIKGVVVRPSVLCVLNKAAL